MSEGTDPNPSEAADTEAARAAQVPGGSSSWNDARSARDDGEPTLGAEPTMSDGEPAAQVPGHPGESSGGPASAGSRPGAALPPWEAPPVQGHFPGYGPPPPYSAVPGQWGQAPWPASSWHWPYQGPAPAPTTRFGSAVFTAAVAAAVAVAAVLGVLIGHALWKNATNPTGSVTPNTFPFGNGGLGSVPGSGSAGAGAPSNASSIAKNVDPGLVDVNTSISFRSLEGAGTGEVLTPNGEVLTNNHVIEGATKITVTDVGNGKTYDATVVGYDRTLDVAVLQLSGASGLSTVTTGDSSKVSVGQGVVAIGNANGAGGTPSYAGGSVTALNQSITASDAADGTSEQLNGLIETNAEIVSGDSGGPLVNTSGEVIGIDTASAGSGGFQFQAPANAGFAIPINRAMSAVRKIESGSPSSTVHIGPTAFLGVEVQPSGAFGGLGGGTPSTPGALIVDVIPGGPADQAGLQANDIVTAVDGHPVTSADSLTDVMLGEKVGTSVQVLYVDQSGQRQSTTVKLGSGPAQ